VDEDNWACEASTCRYLGCASDAECAETFGATGATYRCVSSLGGVPTCVEQCASPADCASPAPSVDEDNWACEASTCRYLGCASDAECNETFGATGGSYRCVPGFGGVRQCIEACSSPADCASGAPSVDEDNWACEAGLCRYLGCTGDGECQATFGSSGGAWLCR
jgi:hypothetical protein